MSFSYLISFNVSVSFLTYWVLILQVGHTNEAVDRYWVILRRYWVIMIEVHEAAAEEEEEEEEEEDDVPELVQSD
jgi:hypothetical protein